MARGMKTFVFASILLLGIFAHLHGMVEAARCDGIPGGTLLLYDNPTECNRYIACQHETDHEWYCPPGEFFNARNQQCEATCPVERDLWCAGVPNGVFIRVPPTEPQDCEKYYTCFNGQMFPNRCPPGFLFSQINQACGFNPAEC
uniref:Chitin-binding type-2 domain-containing protein n=1 Tax=Anopheles dirus TaxID=7168 RepID=A0A182NDH0_9DIPT